MSVITVLITLEEAAYPIVRIIQKMGERMEIFQCKKVTLVKITAKDFLNLKRSQSTVKINILRQLFKHNLTKLFFVQIV